MESDTKCRILVATLGTGRTRSDIAEAIAKSVRDNAANRLLLLCSQKTRAETLPEVLRALDGMNVEIRSDACPSGYENDVQELFRSWHSRWDDLLEGWAGGPVVVDFTSGTKPMSAAAFALAIARNAAEVSYVLGPKDETGRATSSEQALHFAPQIVLGWHAIRQAAEHFNAGAYAAARDLAGRYLKIDALPDEDLRTKARGLHYLAAAYEAWDRFDWKKAGEHFHQITGQWRQWTWLDTPEQCTANYDFLVKLKKTLGQAQSGDKPFPPHLLADLMASVDRRIVWGKWDDAVCRLYRAIEMIAQIALHRDHGIKTGDVDVAKLPEPLRDPYERRRQQGTGKISLGLRDAYVLLNEFDHPLGKAGVDALGEKGRGPLGSALMKRNQSLLAHGQQPISEADARTLNTYARDLARLLCDPEELKKLLDQTRAVRIREM